MKAREINSKSGKSDVAAHGSTIIASLVSPQVNRGWWTRMWPKILLKCMSRLTWILIVILESLDLLRLDSNHTPMRLKVTSAVVLKINNKPLILIYRMKLMSQVVLRLKRNRTLLLRLKLAIKGMQRTELEIPLHIYTTRGYRWIKFHSIRFL
jgi:hypothetical protein